MLKRPIVEDGVCDHASDRECPHYNDADKYLEQLTILRKLVKELYKALKQEDGG